MARLRSGIADATRSYDAWLRRRTAVVEADLRYKHQQMALGVFPFLRATFYRWAALWPAVCPDLARAPRVMAVGDLHVENFGTWRDADGRLVWGVNDFDEAYPLSYANDLVRLMVSAILVSAKDGLGISAGAASKAILAGYQAAIAAGGRPFVLEEKHPVLRAQALSDLRSPPKFWEKVDQLAPYRGRAPRNAVGALRSLLPDPELPYRLFRRRAGLGSLGRTRIVALADWDGARIAREAKTLLPSACTLSEGRSRPNPILYYERILRRAVRCPDPIFAVHSGWITRRLAPDCGRIELSESPAHKGRAELLHAMGWETANVHLGTAGAIPAIRLDLRRRPNGWLMDAARAMAKVVRSDFGDWVTSH